MTHMNDAFSMLQASYAGLNQVQGLIIALIITVLMKEWKQLWAMALAATVLNLLATMILPVFKGAAFHLPKDLLTLGFMIALVFTYVAFAIIVAFFFFVKKNVLKAA